MPIIVGFLELASRLRGQKAMVQAIEANKHLATHTRRLIALGIKGPHVELATDYWEHLQTWLVNEVVSHHGPATRSLPRMLIGTWIGPSQDPRTERAPSGAVLPALAADPARDDAMTCLDLVQVSTVNPPGDWVWAVLSHAATNVYQHTIGLNRGEHWRFVSTVDGVLRIYDAEYAADGPLSPGDITATYGHLAASRARRDQPAVQLRLTLRRSE